MEQQTSGPLLEVRDLEFRYGKSEEPALRGVTLNTQSGEFVVVMGASGAGKTTLFQSFNGIIPRFVTGRMEGTVHLMGVSTREEKSGVHASRCGLVFQDFEVQLFCTTAAQEIAFGAENLGVDPDEIERRITSGLRRVDLEGFEERDPNTLSGGQKQRLAIAAVLAMDPTALAMDEPTTDLDPVGKDSVLQIALQLQQHEDRTMLVAEHETDFALRADRIVVLRDGEVAYDGPPAPVLQDPPRLLEWGIRPLDAALVSQQLAPDEVVTTEDGLVELVQSGRIVVDPAADQRLAEQDGDRRQRLGEPLIEVTGLRHTYPNGLTAVDGIDLEVARGEFVVVLGPNGGGKTTLVKHLNGLLKPTDGRVVVAGRDTADHSLYDLSAYVGFVFQNPDHQLFSETVEDEVAFGPKLRGVEGDELAQRVARALEAVNLAGYEQRDPFALAKGERQRVAVASVLSLEPDILILDEPTTGMDHRELEAMMDLIQGLNDRGHTIVSVTHSVWLAAEHADRVVVVKDGQVALEGPPRDLFRREEELRAASVIPPQAARIANRLGLTALSASELAGSLKASRREVAP